MQNKKGLVLDLNLFLVLSVMEAVLEIENILNEKYTALQLEFYNISNQV